MELQTLHTDTVSGRTKQRPTEPLLSKDELFEILKNQRRRDALRYLKANDGTAKLSDMAEYIAAKENGIDVAALSSSQRKRVYIGLYQCHLPKMASFGVIDFDKDRGTIALLPTASVLDSYLEDEIPTVGSVSRLPIAAAAAVAAVVGAGLLGVPVLSALPATGWAVVSTIALLVLAVSETLSE
ncbi:hypothetical protein SAMN04487949_2323 [Halogranum gelatinilyticum]|uniref:DUF7344 domain-containing protein n=1 Tax=Halogranum gelatinilyticum TaxID=660521 RepID=A0A1G9UST0_9EURY|nr:hypothetical protein [Halogranum gelatinilyticum]SDM62963.1 hypothetical protein SAMN04487949_2323 [Halogranum gelatinilyticum]